MPADWEFLDEHGAPVVVQEDDPLIEPPPRTLPSWLDPRTGEGRLVLVLLLEVIAAWVLTQRHADGTGPTPVRPTPSASSNISFLPRGTVPEMSIPKRDVIGAATRSYPPVGRAAVTETARLLGRLGAGDEVISRPPGCPSRPVGTMSMPTMVQVLARHLPGYSLSTSTSSRGAGSLCRLVVWADVARSDRVVVSVLAPTPASRHVRRTRVGFRGTHGGLLECVQVRTADGWTVLVGGFGRGQDVPPSGGLLGLARDPALRW